MLMQIPMPMQTKLNPKLKKKSENENETRPSSSTLFGAVENKMKDILNIETLHSNTCDFLWFSENLVKNPILVVERPQ